VRAGNRGPEGPPPHGPPLHTEGGGHVWAQVSGSRTDGREEAGGLAPAAQTAI